MKTPEKELPERPRLRDDLIFRQVEEDFVVYDPVSDRTALFNLTAAAVLDLCDGSRTAGEIAEAVAETFSAEVSEVSENVASSLKEFRAHGLLEA